MVNPKPNVLTFSDEQFRQLLGSLQRQAIPAATPAQAHTQPTFKARDIGFFDPDNEVDPVETKEG